MGLKNALLTLLFGVVMAAGSGKAINDFSTSQFRPENKQTIQQVDFKDNQSSGIEKKFEFSDTTSLIDNDNARYLIITHDNFYDDIKPLATWKHKKGMRTKIVKLSETGSLASQIKDYIEDAYNNWQIPPEFLLLVGAPNFLPLPQIGWTYTDNYYTNMDADIYNEILSGRLTVHNTNELQTVVNKILLYERTPDISDSLWFINSCLIVREDANHYPPLPGSDDSIYWDDIHHAKNLMLNYEYNTIDTLSRLLGNNANNIIQSVNNGRAFVLYRGQGVGNWWSPFNVNPDATANGAKLPIVLSITCRTIGTGPTPATAEKWLLTGTPTTPRGGAGYFATTRTISGGAHLRSAVCKGFFNSIFVDGNRTFGEACEEGRKKVYEMYGNSSEYQGFTTLGDPEMNIWTATPKKIDVLHDSIQYTYDKSLNVKVNTENAPIESALVCIVLDSVVYQHGYTSNNGEINFYFDSLAPGTMNLTVTGRNIIPYENTLVVTTGISEYENIKPRTQFRVSPTITSNHFNVSGLEGKVDVYNVTGRRVGKYEVKKEGTNINTSELNPGIYFLKPKETELSPVKIIKTK